MNLIENLNPEESLIAYLLRRYYWNCKNSELTNTADIHYLFHHPYTKRLKDFGKELRRYINDGLITEENIDEMYETVVEKIKKKSIEQLNDKYTLYRGVLLPQNQKIYKQMYIYESWTDNLSIATQFSSNFIKLKSGLQGVVLKKEILKEQILTTYFFNEFWKILDESDQNQHEYIVYDLKEFELNEKNCIKY